VSATGQVIALAAAPFLLDHPKVGELFAPDAIKRARELVKAFNGGVGAYQVRRLLLLLLLLLSELWACGPCVAVDQGWKCQAASGRPAHAHILQLR
jgi:hypothetical protein